MIFLAVGVLLVLSGRFEGFSRPLASASGGVGGSQSALVGLGRRVYNDNCLTCHGGPEIAPETAMSIEYPPRHNATGHTWHHPDCELKEIVREGGDEMTAVMRAMNAPPGAPTMPPFKQRLSADEIDAALAYIKTMWTLEERQIHSQISLGSCPR